MLFFNWTGVWFLWVSQRTRSDGSGCLVLDSLGSTQDMGLDLKFDISDRNMLQPTLLGVHDLEDVIGGMGVGLICLLLVVLLTIRRFEWLQTHASFLANCSIAIVEAFFFLDMAWKDSRKGWLVRRFSYRVLVRLVD